MSNNQLIPAVISGNIAELKSQINAGIDINLKDNNGQTALMYAAYKGNVAIVKLLLENNADPNIEDNDNWVAFKYAEIFSKTDVAKLLRDVTQTTLKEENRGSETDKYSSINRINTDNASEIKFSTNRESIIVGSLISGAMIICFVSIRGFIFTQSPTTNTNQSTNKYNWNFPQSACGDRNPPGEQNFYPVYVNRIDSKTLNHIKRNYCQDAYLLVRKESSNKSIQIASFAIKDKAMEFAQIMINDPNINSGEVGNPSLR
jgi:ankyrin repeat protein